VSGEIGEHIDVGIHKCADVLQRRSMSIPRQQPGSYLLGLAGEVN
jgi:hypothetical protein